MNSTLPRTFAIYADLLISPKQIQTAIDLLLMGLAHSILAQSAFGICLEVRLKIAKRMRLLAERHHVLSPD